MIRTLSAAHRASLRRIVENSGSSAYAKSSVFSSGFLGHILRIILRLAIVRGNLVLPRMPRIFGQNGSYQRPCRGIFVPQLQAEFDVFHFHIDFLHFPLFRSLAARTLTTLHGRQDLVDLKPFYSRFGEMPLVSISHDQRKSLPHANFVATIHHGIPADLHRPSFEQGRYLAFLGRISPEKRPDRAIRIARSAGIPLKIAAKVDKVDEEYFHSDYSRSSMAQA